jgi:NADH dehydrogenase
MSLARAKYAAEQFLKESELTWTIVRGTAFMEFWAKLVGQPLIDTGRTQVFGRGNNPINFVSVDDVAKAVEMAVVDPSLRGVDMEVGGPENLTMNQVVEIFERVSGKTGKVSHVPLAMMRVMAVLMRPINPALARQVQAGVVMDTNDIMAWEPSENRKLYPWLPQTPLVEVLQKGQHPVST